MINDKYISLVLPCKDEGRALKEVLEKIPKEVDEIIVVDNNSKDNTMQIAKNFGAKVIKETRDKNGIGYGYSLSTGIKASTGNIVVCMDGDGSYPIYEISKLIKTMSKEKLDFISCNRIPFKNERRMSFIRTFGVKVLNIILRILYGYKIQDCLTGMWIFRRKAINNINLCEGGWNFSLEIKLNALMNTSIKFSEKPIFYHDRVFDSSKQSLFKTGIQHILFLLKNRFSYSKSSPNLLHQKTFFPLITRVKF